jgi:hypothetical protein
MVEKNLLPGCRVEIIGGKYRNRQGILRYEMGMRYLVLIDGMGTARYLSKSNVVMANVAKDGIEEKMSLKKSVGVNLDNKDSEINKVLDEMKVAKELLSTALKLLNKCEEDLVRIKRGK